MLSGAGINLSASLSRTKKPSTIAPDVSVFSTYRLLTETAQSRYVQHLLLAIEVVSPGNTKRELERKIQIYLELGAYEVWIVQQNQGVRVVQSDGTARPVE